MCVSRGKLSSLEVFSFYSREDSGSVCSIASPLMPEEGPSLPEGRRVGPLCCRMGKTDGGAKDKRDPS